MDFSACYSIHVCSLVYNYFNLEYVDIPKYINWSLSILCVLFHFSSPAPAGPPLNFVVFPGARSITFSWAPPNPTERNGVITVYSVSCTPQTGVESISMQYTQAGTFSLEGFTPATMYSCSIFASNRQGDGPVASKIIHTQNDGKFPFQFLMWVNGFISVHGRNFVYISFL